MKATRRSVVGLGVLALMGCGAGSPARSSHRGGDEGRSVVVVGAGLAGLVVADELVALGFDVVVLEATARAGGRILTLREPFREGQYVEAGATHVIGEPDLLALLDRLGVAIEPRKPREKMPYRISHFDGARSRRRAEDDDPPRHALSAEEARLGERALARRYFADAAGVDPRGALLPPALAAFDGITLDEYLRRKGASEGYRAAYDEGVSGEGSGSMSAAFWLRDVASIAREIALGSGGRVRGGADAIPRALAARLGERVRYGAEVVRIERTDDGATVVLRAKGDTLRLHADRVVCAIPYSVLARVEMVPPLSPAKSRVVKDMPFTSVTRVFAGYTTRTWREAGDYGTAETDLACGRLRDESELQPGNGGVLGAYVSGEKARRLSMTSGDARVATLAADAEKVHPGSRAALYGGTSVAWDTMPFARGAYAWARPGQLVGAGEALFAPEGCVHFAGDHVSYRPGFMHGAVASAKRVVAEVALARAARRGAR